MAEITLYDLPILREGRYACFSFNPWKGKSKISRIKTKWKLNEHSADDTQLQGTSL